MASLIGSGPDQVPTNAMLGNLAYKDTLGMRAISGPAPTLASATTIQPQAPVSFVSGTTNVVTITVPLSMVRGGTITLIPTAVWATTTAGNIALATTAVVSKALVLTYDGATAKWYSSY